MEKEVLAVKAEGPVKHWWVSVLIGLIGVGVGLWAFTTPISAFLALSIVFVISFLVNGLFDIIFAVVNKDNLQSWGWTLAMGIIDLILGLILLSNPALAPVVLVYFIAFWLMFHCIWAIGMSIDMKKYKNGGWKWLLVIAIVGLIISFILLSQPIQIVVLTGYYIAASILIYGIFRIFLGFKLKSINIP